MAKATIGKGVKTKTTWANALKRDWQLYLLLMIPVALVVIFNYASYGGIRMVFMDYKPAKGYAGSKWVGWATFQKVFKDKDFIRALKSSIVFNLLDLAVGFPMPIILALILNELRFPRFKKVTQTILYLPHFLNLRISELIQTLVVTSHNLTKIHDKQCNNSSSDTRKRNVPHTLPTVCTVDHGCLIKLTADTSDCCQINNGAPAHSLPYTN